MSEKPKIRMSKTFGTQEPILETGGSQDIPKKVYQQYKNPRRPSILKPQVYHPIRNPKYSNHFFVWGPQVYHPNKCHLEKRG